MADKAMQGYNGTLMAYGQTGAGKTYTITGATENYKQRGIIPRAIAQVPWFKYWRWLKPACSIKHTASITTIFCCSNVIWIEPQKHVHDVNCFLVSWHQKKINCSIICIDGTIYTLVCLRLGNDLFALNKLQV